MQVPIAFTWAPTVAGVLWYNIILLSTVRYRLFTLPYFAKHGAYADTIKPLVDFSLEAELPFGTPLFQIDHSPNQEFNALTLGEVLEEL